METISPVASLGNAANMYGADTTRDIDQDAFLNAFDKGLDQLSARPEFQEQSTPLDAISGTYSGDVGATKASIQSDTNFAPGENPDANQQTLESRFQSLYFELTHYQVAWKIAQNVQRDISQVLRGS